MIIEITAIITITILAEAADAPHDDVLQRRYTHNIFHM